MAKAAVSSLEKEYLKTDILVIGSGIAGCNAAIMAAEKGLKTTIISKSPLGTSGCSRIASNVAGGPPGMYLSTEDRKKIASIAKKRDKSNGAKVELTQSQRDALSLHVEHVFSYLVDQDAIVDGIAWVQENFFPFMEKRGLYIRRMPDGSVSSNTGPIHQKITWAPRQGQGGPQIMEIVRHEVYALDVDVKEECMATRLLTGETGDVIGAVALDMRTGKLYVISARSIFLCTGYAPYQATRCTGNPDETCDGWMLGYHVGAELVNQEIHYLHVVDTKDPLTYNQHCYPNPNPNTDRTPHMFDSEGQFFYSPDMFRRGTSGSYHLQLKRVIKKIYEGKAKADGWYYSSYRHMADDLDPEFARQRRVFDKLGHNIALAPIENALTWEMSRGGYYCDMKTMQTSIPGLYAVGAAGRYSGFSNCTYSAHLAVQHVAENLGQMELRNPDPNQVASEETRLLGFLRTEPGDGYRPGILQTKIRKIVYDTLVPIKNETKMKQGLAELRKIKEEMVPKMALESATLNFNMGWINAISLDFLLEHSELLMLASLERKESRCSFFREDYPYVDNENWCADNIVKLVGGKPKFRQQPMELRYVRPTEKKVDYFKVVY